MSFYYPAPAQGARGKTSAGENHVVVRFVELSSGARIVEAVRFESPDPTCVGEMILIATVEDAQGATEVTIECKQIPPGIRPQDNQAGCQSTLKKLARYIA